MLYTREDKKLIKLSIKGDKRAVEALLVKYLNFCFSLAVTLIEDQKLAEKAIENTFKQVTENIKDLYSYEGFVSWLYDLLLKNIEEIRPKGKSINSSFYNENNLIEINYSTMLAFDDEEKKQLAQFLEKIRTFDDKEKAVFVLMDFEGLSAPEVGFILGLEDIEVRRLLYRVKRELKEVYLQNRTGLLNLPQVIVPNNNSDEINDLGSNSTQEFNSELLSINDKNNIVAEELKNEEGI
ncbi:MAG: sigma-70 family RNA polymerase sigma factor [Candidatus Sericytochromatia bacterium]